MHCREVGAETLEQRPDRQARMMAATDFVAPRLLHRGDPFFLGEHV